MLNKKLRKNLDIIIFLLFIGIVYAGGWQADVFGFVQRGVLALGLFDAAPEQEVEFASSELGFQLQDAQGNLMDVSQLKGKTIFVNIWASWCPPCVAEMPGIHDLFQQVQGGEHDIVFLMISVDQEQQKAINFIDRKDFEFPVYFPLTALPSEFSYQSIPSTFVISPEGKIVYQKEGMASYDSRKFKDFLLSL
jgi:thiol-disulfide isomerase/thioredoxin